MTEQKLESSPPRIPLQVYVQPTPNPDALKFILNRDVKAEGKATFSRDEDTYDNILARDLLNVAGVEHVHFFENVITVTKKGGRWEDLEPVVMSVVETRMPAHNVNFAGKPPERERRKDLSPELQTIEEILDRTIRPGLQGDGGDLEVVSLEGKTLTIRYQGACGSCPSATQGTLFAIEDILRRDFDPDIVLLPLLDSP
jgi:Fe-S cluster biogenesis protein NfuA